MSNSKQITSTTGYSGISSRNSTSGYSGISSRTSTSGYSGISSRNSQYTKTTGYSGLSSYFYSDSYTQDGEDADFDFSGSSSLYTNSSSNSTGTSRWYTSKTHKTSYRHATQTYTLQTKYSTKSGSGSSASLSAIYRTTASTSDAQTLSSYGAANSLTVKNACMGVTNALSTVSFGQATLTMPDWQCTNVHYTVKLTYSKRTSLTVASNYTKATATHYYCKEIYRLTEKNSSCYTIKKSSNTTNAAFSNVTVLTQIDNRQSNYNTSSNAIGNMSSTTALTRSSAYNTTSSIQGNMSSITVLTRASNYNTSSSTIGNLSSTTALTKTASSSSSYSTITEI